MCRRLHMYMKIILINFILQVCILFLPCRPFILTHKNAAVWKRLGCSQHMQRTWWQMLATPYTGFRVLLHFVYRQPTLLQNLWQVCELTNPTLTIFRTDCWTDFSKGHPIHYGLVHFVFTALTKLRIHFHETWHSMFVVIFFWRNMTLLWSRFNTINFPSRFYTR